MVHLETAKLFIAGSGEMKRESMVSIKGFPQTAQDFQRLCFMHIPETITLEMFGLENMSSFCPTVFCITASTSAVSYLLLNCIVIANGLEASELRPKKNWDSLSLLQFQK